MIKTSLTLFLSYHVEFSLTPLLGNIHYYLCFLQTADEESAVQIVASMKREIFELKSSKAELQAELENEIGELEKENVFLQETVDMAKKDVE